MEQVLLWKETAKELSGSAKRMFMAKVVRLIGYGGQRFVEKELDWNRGTIRKGQLELKTAPIDDKRKGNSGRRPVGHEFPELDNDIWAILEPTGQTDPTFRSTRIYTPMTAKQVHKRLTEISRYTQSTLPTSRTISNRMKVLGYRPEKIKKCLPLKNPRN